MTAEKMNEYKMRITQSGIADLCIVMLEMEIEWLSDALTAYQEENADAYFDALSKASSVQVELMNIMNVENAVSRDIYSVFVYINKLIVESKIKGIPQDIDRSIKMLDTYRQSFIKIASTDTEGPVMASSEKVYAGLTYGTGGLVESSVGGHEFKA